jgi:PST family polysaccharide transporter
VRGSIYSVSASLVTLVLGFLRAVLLARWLLPADYGVVSLALFFLALAAQLRSLGLDRALIHRQEADESALGTYFALRVGTSLVTAVVLTASIPLLARLYPAMPLLGWVLLALVGVDVIKGLSSVQETLLSRDLAFRSLAMTDIVAAVAMTTIAPLLAWRGYGVWALVAEPASGLLARLVMVYLVYRRWVPKLRWHPETARWFWRFGLPTWGASALAFLLDRFDDFWIGTALGKTALGYYSRAYEFARYPRRVVANPLVSVFGPMFARLQGDRLRLSQAFYRSAHVILRSGFLVAGAFALVMPEFIQLVIGQQWEPMLLTFRLMLVYTLLDALLMLGGNLLLAVGRPQALQQSRLVQALVFVPAVVAGSAVWGINGVALAADVMLVLGSWLVYRRLREFVDFSLFRLGFWPLLALTIAWGAGFLLEWKWSAGGTWAIVAAKFALFTAVYLGVLLLVERGGYAQGVRWVWSSMRSHGSESTTL